jgi:hypothetical protein
MQTRDEESGLSKGKMLCGAAVCVEVCMKEIFGEI